MSKWFYEDLPAFRTDLCKRFSPVTKLCRRISGAKDGSRNGNHGGASLDYKWGCLQGDSCCRAQHGLWSGFFAEFPHAFQTDRRFVGLLGGGGEDRANCKIVCRLGENAGDQRIAACECTDDSIQAKNTTGLRDGDVSCIDVNSVKTNLNDKIGAIVQDELRFRHCDAKDFGI